MTCSASSQPSGVMPSIGRIRSARSAARVQSGSGGANPAPYSASAARSRRITLRRRRKVFRCSSGAVDLGRKCCQLGGAADQRSEVKAEAETLTADPLAVRAVAAEPTTLRQSGELGVAPSYHERLQWLAALR